MLEKPMKTVNSICKSFTSELAKIAANEKAQQKTLVKVANDLENLVVAKRAQSQAHMVEATRAEKAIANIKQMFGVEK
jgi:hypothetical protein